MARLAGAVLLLACAACSAATNSTPTGESGATDSAPASESASDTQTSRPWEVITQTPGGATIGQTVVAGSGDSQVAITVRNVRRTPAAGSEGAKDTLGIDVEMCPNIPITAASNDHWLLSDKGKGKYIPVAVNTPELTPQFPFQPKSVEPGQCVSGWVMFEVDPGATLDKVRYLGPGNIIMSWNVPKQ